MRKARELESAAEASGREGDRVNAALLRIELHTELGQPKLAAQVADVWLRRMSAWPGRDSIEDDPRPILEAAAVRGGLRTESEREAVRAGWIATWNAQVEPLERARVWIDGYAEPASSPEEARQALAALKDYAPLPKVLVNGWSALELSKVYSLAGRPADALPPLRTVTSSCRALTEPGDFVRARLRLGEALEASGDATGACTAYAQVLQAWGRERRSVTATTARVRATALGCPAPPSPRR
jgi:serine/threonine-protein kinase